MAVYNKAQSDKPVVLGAAYVGRGNSRALPTGLNVERRFDSTDVYDDIDSLNWTTNVDDRFDVAPSGWNE